MNRPASSLALVLVVASALIGSAACERETPSPADTDEVAAPADSVEWLLTSHILIRHRTRDNPADSVRTKEEARILAESVRRRLDESGESFADVARTFSEDDSNKKRGGRLGPFQLGSGHPRYVEVALGLGAEAISDPFDTELGFLIVTRHALEEATFQSILVSFEGTELSRSDRTREEARALADRARIAAASNRSFESVAEQFTDRDADDLTIHIARGVMSKSVDDIVFSLAPGELSEVRETEYGFHVIRRLR